MDGPKHLPLPGDIVSLKEVKALGDGKSDREDGDIVSADIISLRGSAVANEAN